MEQAHHEKKGIKWDKYTLELVHKVPGSQWDRYTMKQVYIGTGTQWNRIHWDRYTVGQVHIGTVPRLWQRVWPSWLCIWRLAAAMRDSWAVGPFVWTLGDICDLCYVNKFRLNLVLCELSLPQKGIVLLVLCLVYESLPCSHWSKNKKVQTNACLF